MSAPYAIFTSYATSDGAMQGGAPFRKFSSHLKELVGAKVKSSRTHLSFVDEIGIKAGDEWELVLADGVRTAEVMICLVSPRYLGSAWCGKELEIFIRRIEQWRLAPLPEGHPGRFVFPVWWEKPMDRRLLPTSLAAFNPADEGFPEAYRQKGLRQLLSLSKLTAVRKFSEVLSDRIVETLDGTPPLVPGAEIEDFHSIPNAFDVLARTIPYQVAFLACVPDGEAWSAGPATQTLETTLQRTSGRINVGIQALDTSQGLKSALDEAVTRKRLILLIADASTPPDDSAIALINGKRIPNLAVVVLYTGSGNAGSPTSDAWVRQFPEGSFLDAARGGRILLTGPRDLEAAFESIITRARQQMIQRDEPARAVDITLSADAAAAGIPIDLKPILEGPTAAKAP